VSKNLRLKTFKPEEEYVYLTYSLKNDKKEETKILVENYRVLLQKALDWLWEKVRKPQSRAYDMIQQNPGLTPKALRIVS